LKREKKRKLAVALRLKQQVRVKIVRLMIPRSACRRGELRISTEWPQSTPAATVKIAGNTPALTVALLRPNGRFDCAGPVYFDLEIVCSTIFDSSLGIGNGTKERNTRTGT
jgi:hypothetical protein